MNSDQLCLHGFDADLCRECQVEAMQARKQAKKPTSIKSLKNRSKDQEREVAKSYQKAGFPHARRIPMSGAIQHWKGDVDPGELLLVECKQTRSGKLVIEPDWLAQVQKQSKDIGRAGFYALHGWVAKDTEQYHKIVVLPEELWLAILGEWMGREEE